MTYRALIQAAFQPAYWDSGDMPVDRFLAGDTTALSAIPLQTSAALRDGAGRDGARAQTLQQPCVP